MISNEQIAHDLAVAAVGDGWRSNEISFNEFTVIQYYKQTYSKFLRQLNKD